MNHCPYTRKSTWKQKTLVGKKFCMIDNEYGGHYSKIRIGTKKVHSEHMKIF